MLFLEYRKQKMDLLSGVGRCLFLVAFQSKFELTGVYRMFQCHFVGLFQLFSGIVSLEQRSDAVFFFELFSTSVQSDIWLLSGFFFPICPNSFMIANLQMSTSDVV